MRMRIWHLTILAALVLVVFLRTSSVRAATSTIIASPALAWSDTWGWINFNPTQGNVTVGDTALSGYVWSQNYGWINLAPAQGGVHNNGQGVLSGTAWGEQTGWIDFNGVSIGQNGTFAGSASGQTGSITFSCAQCSVQTSWQPVGPTEFGATAGSSSLAPLSLSLSAQDVSSHVITVAAVAPGATALRLGLSLDVLFGPWNQFRSTTALILPASAVKAGSVTVYGQVQDALGRVSPLTPFFFLIGSDEAESGSLPVVIRTPTFTPLSSPLVQTVAAGIANALNIECSPLLMMNLPSSAPRSADNTRRLQFFLLTFLRRGTSQVKINGRYDAATRRAVRDFQAVFPSQLKGTASGVVGSAVRAKINDLSCQYRLAELFREANK